MAICGHHPNPRTVGVDRDVGAFLFRGRRLGLWLFVIAFPSSPVSADPMIGDTGAAVASPETTNINPANVVFMDRAQMGGSTDFLRSETRSIRFPRSPATVEKSGGLPNPLGYQMRPSLVLRPTSKLGLSGFVVPPLLSVNMKFKKIPVVIFKQRNSVDIAARGKVDFMGAGTIGYRVSEKLGVGLGGEYRSLTFDADISDANSGGYIGTVKGKMSSFESLAGVRFDPKPGQLALGIAFTLLSHQQQTLSVNTVIDQDGKEQLGGTNIKSTLPLSRLVMGAQAAFGRLRLIGDLRFTRYDKEVKVFSIVDFKEKKRELYETVAPSFGAVLNVSRGTNVLAGFKFEPTPIGAGSVDSSESEGTAGFGTLDLAQDIIGISQLTPYYPALPFWQFATGLQFSLSPQVVAKESASTKDAPGGKAVSRYYRYTLGAGFGYRQASLGIDEKGEQPGAYLIKRMFVPMLAIVRF